MKMKVYVKKNPWENDIPMARLVELLTQAGNLGAMYIKALYPEEDKSFSLAIFDPTVPDGDDPMAVVYYGSNDVNLLANVIGNSNVTRRLDLKPGERIEDVFHCLQPGDSLSRSCVTYMRVSASGSGLLAEEENQMATLVVLQRFVSQVRARLMPSLDLARFQSNNWYGTRPATQHAFAARTLQRGITDANAIEV
jgi:hypothetical protein